VGAGDPADDARLSRRILARAITRLAGVSACPKEASRMVRTVDEALAYIADQSAHGPAFGENECQMQCHLAYDIPTDGTPTAAAWWAKSAYQHPTADPSTAPRGAFHYFLGGSSGAGHVMVSQGGSPSWSTDIARPGYFDTTTVEAVLKSWPLLRYVGWTEDIDGVRVWEPDPVVKPTPTPNHPNIDAARADLQKALKANKPGPVRRAVNAALRALRIIP